MGSGIWALPVALALRLPGDCPPLEGPGVTQEQVSPRLRWVRWEEQRQAAAVRGRGESCNRFFLKSAGASGRGPMERRASVSLWPACPVTVSQRRVAIEVAGLAVWAEALPETKLTDEQVPFLFLSA